ncbi:MAG: hypothetical protein DWQ37_21625 [Planctomycetota bacterium]|nr:MAG: hypothetical protein DWQ37_21625 [Planctomycetota bacterium]
MDGRRFHVSSALCVACLVLIQAFSATPEPACAAERSTSGAIGRNPFLDYEPRPLGQAGERLPSLPSEVAPASYQFDEDASVMAADGETSLAAPGQYPVTCNGCGCCPCECLPSPAPCVDCPHVSTLGEYFNLRFFGVLELDMLFNQARPVSPGVPFFLAPGPAAGFDQQTVDIHARQTTLGAVFSGPEVGNFQAGGLFAAMLFNDAVIVDQYGFLPLQAYGELRNDDWRFAAGLMFDVFAPRLPTMLPFSALAASGNAGNSFRGQVMFERFFYPAEDVQWTLQGALAEPITTTIDPTFRISEDNGWPNIEARIALGLGPLEGTGLEIRRPFEIGLSGVVGQIRNITPLASQVIADVWGLAVDYRWKVADVWGLAGEVYTGQTLGTYNGGILQDVNRVTFRGIRTTGGWIETFVYWYPSLHSHFGYGVDSPIARDVETNFTALGRTYNSTIFGNLLWDVSPALRIGFEVTWRQTHYRSAPDNEGAGFQTQFQWRF